MDLRNVLRVIGRHWVVVGLGLLLTVGLAAMLVVQIAPAWQARASMLLLPSSTVRTEDGAEIGRNPLENPGNVAVASLSLAQIASTPYFADLVASRGQTGSYQVVVDPAASGAILLVTATGDTEPAAVNNLTIVTAALSEELETLQARANALPDSMIQAQEIFPPDRASPLYGSKIRVIAGVLLVGGVGSISLAFLLDALQRSSRKRNEPDEGDDTGATRDEGVVEFDDSRLLTELLDAGRDSPQETTRSLFGRTGEATG